MGDRCSGQCCEEFTITGCGHTPEEIRTFLREKAHEGVQVADMIVPLRAIVAGTIAPNGTVFADTPPGGGWVFTCKHHDVETGNCGIYETRPRHMCGSYPYRAPCEHKERCTWTLGRLGLWPMTFKEVPDFGMARDRVHLPVIQADGTKDQRARLRADRMELTVSRDIATAG